MNDASLVWPDRSGAADTVGQETGGHIARRRQEARAEEAEQYAELVRAHQGVLVGYLTRMTRCPDRAQELAQEAFVRFYLQRHRYHEQGQLQSYLFRIATNLLRSEERRKVRWRRLRPTYAAGLAQVEESPLRAVEAQETTRRVTAAIAALPLKFRAPLVLREIEGWSYARIAEALNCREGTVKSRVNRAKHRMRRDLEKFWNRSSDEGGEQ